MSRFRNKTKVVDVWTIDCLFKDGSNHLYYASTKKLALVKFSEIIKKNWVVEYDIFLTWRPDTW